MKIKFSLAALMACAILLLPTTYLYAEDSSGADNSYYEESMQGNEDSMGDYENMPMDTEYSGTADEDSSSQEEADSGAPAE